MPRQLEVEGQREGEGQSRSAGELLKSCLGRRLLFGEVFVLELWQAVSLKRSALLQSGYGGLDSVPSQDAARQTLKRLRWEAIPCHHALHLDG